MALVAYRKAFVINVNTALATLKTGCPSRSQPALLARKRLYQNFEKGAREIMFISPLRAQSEPKSSAPFLCLPGREGIHYLYAEPS
jgi:hypothetical protein